MLGLARNDRRALLLILTFGLILRLSMIFMTDLRSENYWEYGEIAKNLVSDKGYSLFYLHGSSIELNYSEKSTPQVSAYMPPLYVYFLLPFLFIKQIVLRNVLLISVQAILGCLAVWLLYVYTARKFSSRVALIAAALFSALPEFVYAAKSFTPTLYFQVFFLTFLLIEEIQARRYSIKLGIFEGVIVAALIYCRSEIALFAAIIIAYKFIKKHSRQAVILAAVVLVLLAPWIVRNCVAFRQFVPLTTNFGFNLYRGNNDLGLGDWGTEEINAKIITSSSTRPLEIAQNEVFLHESLQFINVHPVKAAANGGKKIISLWVGTMERFRFLDIFLILLSLLMLGLCIIGIRRSFNPAKFKTEYLFFIYSTCIAAIFFVLPRYQVMMQFLMLPFSAVGFTYLIDRFSGKESGA